jgi:hypothetical protein
MLRIVAISELPLLVEARLAEAESFPATRKGVLPGDMRRKFRYLFIPSLRSSRRKPGFILLLRIELEDQNGFRLAPE